MSQFIQINAGGKDAFILDVEKVSAIVFVKKAGELKIYAEDQPVAVYDLDPATDMNAVLKQFKSKAHEMFELADDDRFQYQLFVSPKAIQYATVSKPNKKDDGNLGLVMGIRDFGKYSTAEKGIAPEAFEKIIAAAAAEKTFKAYDADVATARFFEPDRLYIDPAAVCRIDDSSPYYLNIHFRKNGHLDVQLSTWESVRSIDQIACDIVNAGDHPSSMKSFKKSFNAAKTSAKAIHKNQALAQRHETQAFIKDLADANGGLMGFTERGHLHYLDASDITACQFFDEKDSSGMVIALGTPEHPKQQSPAPITCRFDTAQERLKAYNNLLGVAAPQMPKKLPKP